MSDQNAPYNAGVVLGLLAVGGLASGLKLTDMSTVTSDQDFSEKPITYRLVMDGGQILQIKVSGIEIGPPETTK